jgi:hypothetical protein
LIGRENFSRNPPEASVFFRENTNLCPAADRLKPPAEKKREPIAGSC